MSTYYSTQISLVIEFIQKITQPYKENKTLSERYLDIASAIIENVLVYNIIFAFTDKSLISSFETALADYPYTGSKNIYLLTNDIIDINSLATHEVPSESRETIKKILEHNLVNDIIEDPSNLSLEEFRNLRLLLNMIVDEMTKFFKFTEGAEDSIEHLVSILISLTIEDIDIVKKYAFVNNMMLIKELWSLKEHYNHTKISALYTKHKIPSKQEEIAHSSFAASKIHELIEEPSDKYIAYIIDILIADDDILENLSDKHIFTLYNRLNLNMSENKLFFKLQKALHNESLIRYSANKISDIGYELRIKFVDFDEALAKIEDLHAAIATQYLSCHRQCIDNICTIMSRHKNLIVALGLHKANIFREFIRLIEARKFSEGTKKMVAAFLNLDEQNLHGPSFCFDNFCSSYCKTEYIDIIETMMEMLEGGKNKCTNRLSSMLIEQLSKRYTIINYSSSQKGLREIIHERKYIMQLLHDLNIFDVFFQDHANDIKNLPFFKKEKRDKTDISINEYINTIIIYLLHYSNLAELNKISDRLILSQKHEEVVSMIKRSMLSELENRMGIKGIISALISGEKDYKIMEQIQKKLIL